MPDDLFVYRTTDPRVLDALADYDAGFLAYKEQVRAILDEAGVGHYKIWGATGGFRPGEFYGLDIPQDEFPPDGWRQGKTMDCAVPDKRYAAGKRTAAALKAVKHPGDPLQVLPGMPPDVLTPGTGGFMTPGLSRGDQGATIYVTWRTNPEGRESFTRGRVPIDHEIWERIPLSTYYAAREADPAVKAGAAS